MSTDRPTAGTRGRPWRRQHRALGAVVAVAVVALSTNSSRACPATRFHTE